MKTMRTTVAVLALTAVVLASGCAARKVSFAEIERPPRAPEMDAYNVFVGKWAWEAEMLNADGPDKNWKGTAEWNWALDKRTLHGVMSAESEQAKFMADGVWSWHPKKKKYIWWMFNNWGYPQQGKASYDEDAKCWKMSYRSVGLDGTTSYGVYRMAVVDDNTLDWSVDEWADALHLVKKMEMTGKYTRK